MTTSTMLVATRDEELREGLGRLAWMAALEVETLWAGSAGRAFHMARQDGVRLVLADDSLGRGTLPGLVRRLRRLRPDVTVVCVTSTSEPEIEIELRQSGVLFVMVRPIDLPLLSRVLQRAIESDTRKYRRVPVSPPLGVRALSQNA